MKYLDKSFTVPASAGSKDYCVEHGHTMPDSKGRCLRCGSRTTVEAFTARLRDESPIIARIVPMSLEEARKAFP